MDEAAKMNKLVKNLLTLNQLESGKDAVVMERFDICIPDPWCAPDNEYHDRTERSKGDL